MVLKEKEQEKLDDYKKTLKVNYNSILAELLWAAKIRVEDSSAKEDAVILVDGIEGSGKTNLITQCAHFLAPDKFDLEQHVTWNPPQFIKEYMRPACGEPLVYDEASTGLSSNKGAERQSQMVQQAIYTGRSKRRFILMASPRFYRLNPDVIGERSLFLLHVFRVTKTVRRFDIVKRYKEGLYNKAKRFARSPSKKSEGGEKIENLYRDSCDVPNCWFSKAWVIDEDKYDVLKDAALVDYFGQREKSLGLREFKYLYRYLEVVDWIKANYKLSDLEVAKIHELGEHPINPTQFSQFRDMKQRIMGVKGLKP